METTLPEPDLFTLVTALADRVETCPSNVEIADVFDEIRVIAVFMLLLECRTLKMDSSKSIYERPAPTVLKASIQIDTFSRNIESLLYQNQMKF